MSGESGSEERKTVLEEFSLKRLFPRDRLFTGAGQSVAVQARCAVKPSVYRTEHVEALAGCCEFGTGIVYAGCEGRTCSVTGCFCEPGVFRVAVVFEGCTIRREKLAAEHL